MKKLSADLPNNPFFLQSRTVFDLHALQTAKFGGDQGIRDAGLLDSALAQPMASYGEEYLHKDLFEMAAAYLFHIVKNHPFIDGNKRTGLQAALVFLESNGIERDVDDEYLFELTMGIAEGRIGKFEAAGMLRKLYSPRRKPRRKKRKPTSKI